MAPDCSLPPASNPVSGQLCRVSLRGEVYFPTSWIWVPICNLLCQESEGETTCQFWAQNSRGPVCLWVVFHRHRCHDNGGPACWSIPVVSPAQPSHAQGSHGPGKPSAARLSPNLSAVSGYSCMLLGWGAVCYILELTDTLIFIS